MDIATMIDDVDVRRLRISGHITQNGIDQQSAVLDRLMRPGDSPLPLLLDLTETDFVDSSGLGWLLMWHNRYKGAGSRLVLHSVPPIVLDVLRAMRLDLVLNIAADEHAAHEIIERTAG